MKGKKEKPAKPKYNIVQTVCYMVQTAWQCKEKKVLVFCACEAVLYVASNLVELYLSPSVLSAVERRVSFGALIGTICFFVGLLMLISAASEYLTANKLFGKVAVRLEIINQLNKKACTTSYCNIESEAFFKPLSTKAKDATSSNSAATEAIWNTLAKLLRNCIGFVIYMLLLSKVDIRMAVLILITSLIGYIVNKQLNAYRYRHKEEESEITSRIWYNLDKGSDYKLAKDIRMFGMRDWLTEVTEKAFRAYHAFQRKAENVYIWGRISELVLTFLRNGIAYVYLMYLVLENQISAAQFLLYFSAVQGFSSWIGGIVGDLLNLHRYSIDISVIMEVLNYPEPFLFEDGKALAPKAEAAYEIRLEHVTFRYPEAKEDTLVDINLTLHPGEKLAVVGLNGAGKTTLIKLLCGFLDPTEGRVLLNGQDIRQYNRRDYYQLFSAVFQDFSLLAASIAVNVAQTEDNIQMERVKDCIEKAGLSEKINSLKDRLETKLNRQIYEDGIELSGGETQRLALARALYKDAPIILLDEPTAALDPLAEEDIYLKYNEMTAGRSSVYISHRLASTRFCDRIILLADHKIAEVGTHEELLAKKGRYAELFGVQSRYYSEGGLEDEK